MTDQKTIELGETMFQVENDIDRLLESASELLGRLSRFRAEEGSSMMSTQRPLSRIAGVQQDLTRARLKMAGVHGDLAKLVPSLKDLPWGCTCAPMARAAKTHLSLA